MATEGVTIFVDNRGSGCSCESIKIDFEMEMKIKEVIEKTTKDRNCEDLVLSTTPYGCALYEEVIIGEVDWPTDKKKLYLFPRDSIGKYMYY